MPHKPITWERTFKVRGYVKVYVEREVKTTRFIDAQNQFKAEVIAMVGGQCEVICTPDGVELIHDPHPPKTPYGMLQKKLQLEDAQYTKNMIK